MAEITTALVKELRERTGAGMMDCKKALAETNGDIEGATDWLRKKGLAEAAKKAGRSHRGPGRRHRQRPHRRRWSRSTARPTSSPATTVPGLAAGSWPWHPRRATSEPCAARHPGQPGARSRRITQRDRHHRREHEPAPRRQADVGQGTVAIYLHNNGPGLGKIGVLVALEERRRPGGSPSSASSSHARGGDHPASPDRRRAGPEVVERERGSVPRRRARPASPRTSSRRWSRAASASGRKWCCSSNPSS